MPRILFNSFVRRQTAGSRFGHTNLTDDQVLAAIEANWDKRKQGYREGVVLVPVPPQGWFSGTVDLKEGMTLKATYEPRKAGERPRLHVGLQPPIKTRPDGSIYEDYEGAKQPAAAVDIVLYASTVLAEDGDNQLPAEPDNWEIISLNPRLCVEEEPIQPGVLMANHFHDDGGTHTLMSAEAFVEALRKSRAYWNGKITLG
jgi:hypothetical protein